MPIGSEAATPLSSRDNHIIFENLSQLPLFEHDCVVELIEHDVLLERARSSWVDPDVLPVNSPSR